MKNTLHNIEGGSATVGEALKIAGCDFEAKTSPVFDHNFQPIPDRMAVYRDDTEQNIGLHSKQYGVIQYKEAFKILDGILGERSAQVQQVATLNGGAGCMIRAKMPESIEVLKGDNIDVYLNAISTHDGSRSTSAWFSGVRLSCTNQIDGMYKSRKQSKHYDIRHTTHALSRLSVAQCIMAMEIKCIESIRENAQILANKSMNRKQTESYINRMFPSDPMAKRDGNKLKREKIMGLVESGQGTDIEGVKGTAWGAFNAVTEWFDHHSGTRGDSNRGIRSILSGESFRRKAFENLMAV